MADESVKRLSVTGQWSRESDLITVILFLSGHGPEFLYSLLTGVMAEERSCVPSSSRDNQASSECQYQARPVSVTYFSIISGAGLMSDGEIGARTGGRAPHDWKHNLPGTSFTDLYWHYNHYSQEKP